MKKYLSQKWMVLIMTVIVSICFASCGNDM